MFEARLFRTGAALLTLLCCLAVAGGSSAAKGPGAAKKAATLTEAVEIQIGMEADKKVRAEIGIYADRAELTAYVQKIGGKIAARSDRPKLEYHVGIVDSADLNAFALPGGYVYVSRGLLARMNSEDALAWVLGHEIAHVAARHGSAAIAEALGDPAPASGAAGDGAAGEPVQDLAAAAHVALRLALARSSPGEEREADDLAAKYVKRAGFGPRGAAEVSRMMAALKTAQPARVAAWYASHPSAPDPTADPAAAGPPKEAEKDAAKEAAASERAARRDPYLQKIDGIRIGWWSPQGYLKGTRYVNLKQETALMVPAGWTIQPREDALVMTRPGEGYRAEMTVQPLLRPGTSVEVAMDYARKAPQQGLEVTRAIGGASLPGGDAGIVTMRGRGASGVVSIRKMFMAHLDRVYILTFTVPEEKTDETTDTFRKLTGSIGSLDPDDIAHPPPEPRLTLYRAAAGDTWATIAAARVGSEILAGPLAGWNGETADAPVAAGTLVKIPPTAGFE